MGLPPTPLHENRWLARRFSEQSPGLRHRPRPAVRSRYQRRDRCNDEIADEMNAKATQCRLRSVLHRGQDAVPDHAAGRPGRRPLRRPAPLPAPACSSTTPVTRTTKKTAERIDRMPEDSLQEIDGIA